MVCRRCGYYLNHWALLLVLKTDELELKASVVKSSIAVVFCPSAKWTFSIPSLDFPMIHELWWSKNDMWGRLLILAGTILILDSPVLLYCWVWSCIMCWKEDECRLFTGDYSTNCVLMFHNSTSSSYCLLVKSAQMQVKPGEIVWC